MNREVLRRPAAAVPRLASRIVPIAPPLETARSPQTGRGVRGQSVYCIVMPMPTADMITARDTERPSDITSNAFALGRIYFAALPVGRPLEAGSDLFQT